MSVNTDHLKKVLSTLERSLSFMEKSNDELDYDMFRNSAVKSFELAMETSGKLLRKALLPYSSSKKAVWTLVYKDLFRQAARHGLLSLEEVERWFEYRDNRNETTHDYGEQFAENTLKLLPHFLIDAKNLAKVIENG